MPGLKSSAEPLRWLDARLTRTHNPAVFELPASSEARPDFLSAHSCHPPAAKRLSRMPTGGRHRAATPSVLDGRVSEGQPGVGRMVAHLSVGRSRLVQPLNGSSGLA